MEAIEFSGQQQVFLTAICKYFHENADWPTYGQLDTTLWSAHAIDVEDIGKSLEQFMFNSGYGPQDAWNEHRQVLMSVPALYACQKNGIYPELAEDLDAFMQVVRYCVEKYNAEGSDAQVTSDDMNARCEWSALVSAKAFRLVLAEGFYHSGGPTEPLAALDGWSFTLSSNVRKYRGVQTIEEYLDARAKQQRASRPPSGLEVARRLYESGWAANELQSVQSDSSNATDIPTKLPQPIFISYRRDDSAGHAGHLRVDLTNRYGADKVFMDITIEPGEDFVNTLETAVSSCAVLLAVIGRQWLTVTDANTGMRRLDSPNDFVRIEIASALQRNIRVIPLLVHRAQMPNANALPDDLKPLARRQAHEITDSRWEYDVTKLMTILDKIVGFTE